MSQKKARCLRLQLFEKLVSLPQDPTLDPEEATELRASTCPSQVFRSPEELDEDAGQGFVSLDLRFNGQEAAPVSCSTDEQLVCIRRCTEGRETG